MIDELFELVLTCSSWQEAQNIADSLLDKHLVTSVEFMETKSSYRWKKDKKRADEIKLIMLTRADSFKKVEMEVAKLHSYDTFVLQSIPVSNTSTKASNRLMKEING